ncbi:hypothetical protein ACEUZ9_002787 [Paracoccus litorisediminis]
MKFGLVMIAGLAFPLGGANAGVAMLEDDVGRGSGSLLPIPTKWIG